MKQSIGRALVRLLSLWTVLKNVAMTTNAQAACEPGMANVYFKVQLNAGLSFNDYYAEASSFQNSVATLAAVPLAQVYLEEFQTTSKQMAVAGDANTFIHIRVCTAEQDTTNAAATVSSQRTTITNNINAFTTIATNFVGHATVPIQSVTSDGETFFLHAPEDPMAPVYEASLRLSTISASQFSDPFEYQRLAFALVQEFDFLAIPDVIASDVKVTGTHEETIGSVTTTEINYIISKTTITGSTQAANYEAKLNAWTDTFKTLHGSNIASAVGLYLDVNGVQIPAGAVYDARTVELSPELDLKPEFIPGDSGMIECYETMPHVYFDVKMGDAVSFNEYLGFSDAYHNAFMAAVAMPDGTSLTLANIDTTGAATRDTETLFYVSYRVCLTNVAPDASDADILAARTAIKAAVENTILAVGSVAGATEAISVTSVVLVGEDIEPPVTDSRPFYVGEFKIQETSVLPLDSPTPLLAVKFEILSILAAENVVGVLPADIKIHQPYDTNTAGTTTANVGTIPFTIYRSQIDGTSLAQTTAFNDLFTVWDATKQTDAGNVVATALGVYQGMSASEQTAAAAILLPVVLFSDGVTQVTDTTAPIVCDRLSPNVYFKIAIGTSNTAVSSFDPVHKIVTAKIAEISTIPLTNFVIDGISTSATSMTDATSPLEISYRACLFLPDSADAATVTAERTDFSTKIQNTFPMDPDALNLYDFSTELITLVEAPTLVGEGVIPAVDSRTHYQAKFVMENTAVFELTAWRLIKLRLKILDTLSNQLNIPNLLYTDLKIHAPAVIPNAYVTISSVYVSIYRFDDSATSAQTVAMDTLIQGWTLETQALWGETFAATLGFFKDEFGVDLPAADIEAIKQNKRPVFIVGQDGIDAAILAYSNAAPSESPSLSTAEGIPAELLVEPATTVFDIPTDTTLLKYYANAEACAAESLFCVHLSWDGKIAAVKYVLESIDTRTDFSSVITTPDVVGNPVTAPVIMDGNVTTWTFQVPTPPADPDTGVVPTITPKLDLTMTLSQVGAAAGAEKLVVKATAALLSASSATSMVSGISYDGTRSVKYKSTLLNGKELALFLNVGTYGATDGFYPVGVNGPFMALNSDI